MGNQIADDASFEIPIVNLVEEKLIVDLTHFVPTNIDVISRPPTPSKLEFYVSFNLFSLLLFFFVHHATNRRERKKAREKPS